MVEGYLLDTSALTPLVDASHLKHELVTNVITGLGDAPIYVSVIALAEMLYGIVLYEKAEGKGLPNAEKMISHAKLFPRMEIGRHTALEYAKLKADLAAHYLPKVAKQFRKKWVEDWIDKFTGKRLGIDDNDLWICAQAREINFMVIADDKMSRIRQADPLLRWCPINPTP